MILFLVMPAGMAIGPPLWSRLKDLNNRWMTDIRGPERMNPQDFGDTLNFPPVPAADQSSHFTLL